MLLKVKIWHKNRENRLCAPLRDKKNSSISLAASHGSHWSKVPSWSNGIRPGGTYGDSGDSFPLTFSTYFSTWFENVLLSLIHFDLVNFSDSKSWIEDIFSCIKWILNLHGCGKNISKNYMIFFPSGICTVAIVYWIKRIFSTSAIFCHNTLRYLAWPKIDLNECC